MTQACIALLGRRDEPTDAVEQYCRYLAAGLASEHWNLHLERVLWHEQGWPQVLSQIKAHPAKWRDTWLLLQYTALAWSSRALPFMLPRLVSTLRQVGARCAVVFHDAQPYPGAGIVLKVRQVAQARIMRRLSAAADLSVLTVPLEQISWLPSNAKAVFVPVGANLPDPERAWAEISQSRGDSIPTVAVFSPTGGVPGRTEARLAAQSLLMAAQTLGPMRLLVLGRNSDEVGGRIRELLAGHSQVQVEILGLLSPERIVSELARSHVLLFTCGELSTRRGSGIAGIACGLPLIALEGAETAGPIREAGVLWVSKPDTKEFGSALVRLFTEPGLRADLAGRSRAAYQTHFCWPAIARQIATELQKHRP